ncbi:hypothetical protein [Paraliobacillus ryukyuensis]|uniref:hypothetical protein n=1 Tax=Paraliobacillus ryukyuensis TaxID=200904 RepID=UPI0009A791BA|nr:hypothetical protein [Paraliobacillus ryukyuensis]
MMKHLRLKRHFVPVKQLIIGSMHMMPITQVEYEYDNLLNNAPVEVINPGNENNVTNEVVDQESVMLTEGEDTKLNVTVMPSMRLIKTYYGLPIILK